MSNMAVLQLRVHVMTSRYPGEGELTIQHTAMSFVHSEAAVRNDFSCRNFVRHRELDLRYQLPRNVYSTKLALLSSLPLHHLL
jgi:hypothetical protein